MSVVEAIADYLQAQGRGTVGTDIFIGLMPDSPDTSVTVYESAGPGTIQTFGGGVALDRVSIQISVRGVRDDYPTARNRAVTIRDTLASVTEVTQGSVRFVRLDPTGYVNSIGRDEEDRPVFTINFIATVDL